MKWADQSPLRYTITRGTGCVKSPKLRADRAWNGRPVVSFNFGIAPNYVSNGECLKIPSLAAFEDFTAGMTAFVAARFFPPEIPLDRTSGGAFFAFNGVSGVFANAISFGRVSGHDKGLLVRYEETTDAGPNGFMNEFEGATADANAHVFEVSASGGTPGAPAGGVVAVDGVIVQMSRSNAVVPARVPRTDNYVGAAPLRVDPDRLFIGDMGEVIVFARQMQAAERDRIRAYLKARWRTP